MSRLRCGALVALWAAACNFEVPAPYGAGTGGGQAGGADAGAGGAGAAASGGNASGGGGAGGGGGACEAPLAACPDEPGCFDTSDDPDHCGDRCEACLENGVCAGGVCGCPALTIECSNPPGCFDPRTDLVHCGDCNTACDARTEVCSEGVCCPTGHAYCVEPVPGCFDTSVEEAHCGDCGVSCELDEVCEGGDCVCQPGSHACPVESGCFDDEDDAHCGDTCQACPADRSCVAGACACDGGLTDCGGECVDVSDDPLHCGACSHACSTALFPGAACVAGLCQPAPEDTPLGVTRGLAVDATTSPSTLYAIDVNGPIFRLREGEATESTSSGLTPASSVATMSASGGQVAYGYFANLSGPLRVGPWGAISDALSSPSGFTMVGHAGGELLWGTQTCVRKNPAAPVDLACIPSAVPVTLRPDPADPQAVFVHTLSSGGTQGPIRRIALSGGVLASFPGSAPFPQSTLDEHSSFATDEAGAYVYYFRTDVGLELVRYELATGAIQPLFSYTGGLGVALLRDGAQLYWAVRASDDLVTVRRATTAQLNAATSVDPPVGVALASFTVAGVQFMDFGQDAGALYFLRDAQVYRLAK